MKIPSHSLALSRVDWNVFATITFRKEVSEARAIREGERFLHYASCLSRQKLWRLQWAMRVEKGERFGRVHLHFLLRVSEVSIGLFVVSHGRASVAYKWCKKQFGIARFRRVEAERDSVVSYMVKDIDAGADVYELAKTSRAQILLTSDSAKRCIRKRGGTLVTNGKPTNTL